MSLFGKGDSLKFPDFPTMKYGPRWLAWMVIMPTKYTVLYQTVEDAAFFLAMQAEGFWYVWDNGRELTDERIFRQLKESDRAKQYQAKFLELYSTAVSQRLENPRTTAIKQFVAMINAEAIDRSWDEHFAEVELQYSSLWTRTTTRMAQVSKKTLNTLATVYSEFVIQYIMLILRMGGVVVDGMFTGGQVVLEKTGDLANTAWEKS